MKMKDWLQTFLYIRKLYERDMGELGGQLGLTVTELEILSFLHNNPGRDTASDIVELRMIPKANVSQAVERLMRKGLLERTSDPCDRRRIHLKASPQAAPAVGRIVRVNDRYTRCLFRGIGGDDLALCARVGAQVAENARRALDQSDPRKEPVTHE